MKKKKHFEKVKQIIQLNLTVNITVLYLMNQNVQMPGLKSKLKIWLGQTFTALSRPWPSRTVEWKLTFFKNLLADHFRMEQKDKIS